MDQSQPPIVLASGSSIRRTLLANAGLCFTVQTAPIDERALEKSFGFVSPPMLAEHLASAKAKEVSRVLSQANPSALVIGADQVLSCEGSLLHKAETYEEADIKLAKLQGKTHQLISAAAIVQQGSVLWTGTQTANLTMRALSMNDRAAYLAKAGDAITQSVGAYRLEEMGVSLFDAIEGDYFTILGLPLLPLLGALRAQGIDPLNHKATA